MRYIMKRLLIAMVLCSSILVCAQNSPKVLLFMRNAQSSGDLEYMLKKEAGGHERYTGKVRI